MNDKNLQAKNIRQDEQKLDNEENDFFNRLQKKEKKQGEKVRGGGHNWTTFIEFLLGDW